jgi:putative ABC transport system permease protein
MLSDFKFAVRTLAKAPGFTALAVLTLALAIGVNSAIFAIINGLILKPLVPLRPEEVVNVFTARQDAKQDYRQFSHAEFAALRESKEVFRDVAAIQYSLAGIGSDGSMRRSFAYLVSDNFFSLMGVQPAAGRFFSPEECRPNTNIAVVIVSHAFWQQLGGRADLVGSLLRVNGQPCTVIGITPEGFGGTHAVIGPDVWLPLGLYSQLGSAFSDSAIPDLNQPKNYTLNIIARLNPGLSLEAATPRLPVLGERLTSIQPPDSAGKRELQIEPPSRFSISTSPSSQKTAGLIGFLLAGMAGVVLLIASLNLANMLLARGTARAKEIAIRFALGASRWQIVRQLLCEGLLLALAGGAAGLLVSLWSNDLLVHSLGALFSSMNFSLVMQLKPDATILAVTFLFCLVSTLIFSLGPALKATRTDLVNELKQQGADSTATGRLNRFFAPRQVLVMAQIALSLMLLFSAGLFLRGALKASGLKPGFEPKGVVTSELDFSLANTSEADGTRLMFAAVDRLTRLPGIEQVALCTMLPYGNITNIRRIVPAEVSAGATPEALDKASANGLSTSVSTGYFKSLGITLLAGRDFTEAESRNRESARVAIVDETLAKKLFPDGNAVGRRVRYTQAPSDGSPAEMEIVGVVSAHRHDVLTKNNQHLFVPLAQSYSPDVYLTLRLASRDRTAVLGSLDTIRQALRSVDAALPALQTIPFSDIVDRNIGLWIVRIGAALFGIFGAIALMLAVIGVYGVKAYAVARRTREIGIRMALGAHPSAVFRLIMRQGVLQTALATGVGIALALGAGQVLSKILFQVSPADPLALASAALVLAAAALLACWIPARRATRVNPITALRTE